MVWWDILYSEDRVPASSGDQAQFDWSNYCWGWLLWPGDNGFIKLSPSPPRTSPPRLPSWWGPRPGAGTGWTGDWWVQVTPGRAVKHGDMANCGDMPSCNGYLVQQTWYIFTFIYSYSQLTANCCCCQYSASFLASVRDYLWPNSPLVSPSVRCCSDMWNVSQNKCYILSKFGEFLGWGALARLLGPGPGPGASNSN